MNIFEILCVYVRVCQFSSKTNSFDFFSPNLPKNGFRVGKSKKCCQNKNQHPRYTMRANFQPNWTTLTLSVQILPKKDLGLEIQKTNGGTRISIVEMPCVPILRKNGKLWLFQPKFAQKWILGIEFQKSTFGFGICTSEIPCVSIFSFMDNFDFFAPNLPKNGFCGQNVKNLKSGFGISILEILRVPIFRQNGQLWIFGPKFAQK